MDRQPTHVMISTHELLIRLLGHRLCGLLIALLGAAGLLGTFITFWPR
jgi:hypothetical protein